MTAMRGLFASVLVGLTVLAPMAATAQPAGKVWRIGIPSFGSVSIPSKQGAFTEALRDLGYIEGRNLAIEWRCCAGGNIDRLNELTRELTQLPVDVLVVVGPQAARAAKAATRTIPIVFLAVADPIATGLVESLAHPGGNITGVTHLVSGDASGGFAGKILQLLKEAVPAASRFAILINPTNPVYHTRNINDWANELARSLGSEVRVVEARERNELGPAFDQMRRDRRDGLMVAADLLFSTERQFIADLAARHRIPAIYMSRDHVDAGGFMSYSTNFPELFRKGASYVDKILKGTKPADLPVEQPTKFDLVINLKTAKALGLTIPPSVLGRADQVIE